MEKLFLLSVVFDNCFAGKCLNTAYTSCDTGFGHDLKEHDGACILYMSTTTELFGEVSHRYHTYLLVVFLTEECHCSGFLSLFYIHDVCVYFKACLNLFVYKIFCCLDLLSCHSLEMSKVKTKSVRCYQRTFLLYVGTKNCFQRFLKKMCRTVVLLGIFSCIFVYFQGYGLTCGDHAGLHMSYMAEFAATELDGVLNNKLAICCLDHTDIAFLSTHGCIERSLLYKYGTLLSLCKRIHDLCLCSKDSYF